MHKSALKANPKSTPDLFPLKVPVENEEGPPLYFLSSTNKQDSLGLPRPSLEPRTSFTWAANPPAEVLHLKCPVNPNLGALKKLQCPGHTPDHLNSTLWVGPRHQCTFFNVRVQPQLKTTALKFFPTFTPLGACS